MARGNGTTQGGFTLLATLAALFLLALATQGVMAHIGQQVQREREAELLYIGKAYADAIGAFYEQSPGVIKRWPAKLEELVDDRRFVTIRRHIRKLYADPVMRSKEWGLVLASDGGVMGVYSLSAAKPIRTAAMELAGLKLSAAGRYADWQFVYQPPASGTKPSGTPAQGKP